MGLFVSVCVPAEGKGRSRGETELNMGLWESGSHCGFLSQNKSPRRPIQASLLQKAWGEVEGQGLAGGSLEKTSS